MQQAQVAAETFHAFAQLTMQPIVFGLSPALYCYLMNTALAIHAVNPRFTSQPFFHTLIAFVLSNFGGSLIAGMILGEPPGWMLSNHILLWLIIVLLTYKWVTWLGPITGLVRMFIALPAMYHWMLGVCEGGVDRSRRMVDRPDALVFAMIIGILKGCGGGIISAFFNLKKPLKEWKFGAPESISPALVRAATVAFLYLSLSELAIRGGPQYKELLTQEIIELIVYSFLLVIWISSIMLLPHELNPKIKKE